MDNHHYNIYFPSSAYVTDGKDKVTAEEFQTWLTSTKGSMWTNAIADLRVYFQSEVLRHQPPPTVREWHNCLRQTYPEVATDSMVHSVFCGSLVGFAFFPVFPRVLARHPCDV
jgi:hypothetical protein